MVLLIVGRLFIVCLVITVLFQVLRAAVVLWAVLIGFFRLVVHPFALLVWWAFVFAQVMCNLAVYLRRVRSLWLCLFVFVNCCLPLAAYSSIISIWPFIPYHNFFTTTILTFLQRHKHFRHFIRVIQQIYRFFLRSSWLLHAQGRQNIHLLPLHTKKLLNRCYVPHQQLFLHLFNRLVVPFTICKLLNLLLRICMFLCFVLPFLLDQSIFFFLSNNFVQILFTNALDHLGRLFILDSRLVNEFTLINDIFCLSVPLKQILFGPLELLNLNFKPFFNDLFLFLVLFWTNLVIDEFLCNYWVLMLPSRFEIVEPLSETELNLVQVQLWDLDLLQVVRWAIRRNWFSRWGKGFKWVWFEVNFVFVFMCLLIARVKNVEFLEFFLERVYYLILLNSLFFTILHSWRPILRRYPFELNLSQPNLSVKLKLLLHLLLLSLQQRYNLLQHLWILCPVGRSRLFFIQLLLNHLHDLAQLLYLRLSNWFGTLLRHLLFYLGQRDWVLEFRWYVALDLWWVV